MCDGERASALITHHWASQLGGTCFKHHVDATKQVICALIQTATNVVFIMHSGCHVIGAHVLHAHQAMQVIA